jgi:RNA polymerase-interacting CarD/CdnL/TRCF family regulator
MNGLTKMIEQTIERTAEVLQHLYGAVEQAATPRWLAKLMVAEVPADLLKSAIVVDPYCGRGTILIEAVAQKHSLSKSTNNSNNAKLLEKIVTSEICGNDISGAFHGTATATFQRLLGKSATINIDNQDSIAYTIPMTKKIPISITNPPYQPMIGVKKGGNEYKRHVLAELKRAPRFGVANIPMTFMVQDPYDQENKDFRNALLAAGLKKIVHVRPDAYKANVLTIYLVWEQGYDGTVEFVTYDLNNVKKNHSIKVDRKKLHNLGIWPVARTLKEFNLAIDVLSHSKKKYDTINSKQAKKTGWCVEWEYLIGMEKERLNRKTPVRGITKRGPKEAVRGERLSRFVNVVSEAAADSLVDFLNTAGQEWQRCIPRGSSVENWMMGPVIEMWKEKNPQFSPVMPLVITKKKK